MELERVRGQLLLFTESLSALSEVCLVNSAAHSTPHMNPVTGPYDKSDTPKCGTLFGRACNCRFKFRATSLAKYNRNSLLRPAFSLIRALCSPNLLQLCEYSSSNMDIFVPFAIPSFRSKFNLFRNIHKVRLPSILDILNSFGQRESRPFQRHGREDGHPTAAVLDQGL